MRITDEQKERAAYVNLPQFLMTHGFDLKKVGKEYVWKEHDSLHIKDNGPGERGVWHRFSTGDGGDNIGFLREFMGISFIEAVLQASDFVVCMFQAFNRNTDSYLREFFAQIYNSVGKKAVC